MRAAVTDNSLVSTWGVVPVLNCHQELNQSSYKGRDTGTDVTDIEEDITFAQLF